MKPYCNVPTLAVLVVALVASTFAAPLPQKCNVIHDRAIDMGGDTHVDGKCAVLQEPDHN